MMFSFRDLWATNSATSIEKHVRNPNIFPVWCWTKVYLSWNWLICQSFPFSRRIRSVNGRITGFMAFVPLRLIYWSTTSVFLPVSISSKQFVNKFMSRETWPISLWLLWLTRWIWWQLHIIRKIIMDITTSAKTLITIIVQ